MISVDADGVDVQTAGDGKQQRIAAKTVLWAAGVRASGLGKVLANRAGATLDRFLSEGEDRSMRAWARVAGARELALAAPENVNRPADLLGLEARYVRH